MTLMQIQKDALDELFANAGDEFAVLQKFDIQPADWRRWLADTDFAAEMNFRRQMLQRQADMMLAKFRPMALAVLMSLCQSQNEEISRKACVELLSLKAQDEQNTLQPAVQPDRDISPLAAEKILEILAEEKANKRETQHG
jgi:hypothetical protein